MKKVVVGIVVVIMLVASFIAGAYAGGDYWVGKLIDIQESSWCEMQLNEEREYNVYNDQGNTCLGEFILKRVG